jgi:two-component system, response regulator
MNKHVILLAEDNPDDVTLTLLAFKQIKFPHRIVVAEDGEEALDYLFGTGRYAKKCKPPTPLLIILDRCRKGNPTLPLRPPPRRSSSYWT